MSLSRTVLAICLLSGFTVVKSQTISNPQYGLKSHETLNILKIESTPAGSKIYLTIENRREGGYFCADKNIYLIYPDGSKIKLISSKGIPVCPKVYQFKKIGEKLDFELSFPPLKSGTQTIDVIEDCNDNCFSFYGICLNMELNKNIDEASMLAEKGEVRNALLSFKSIASGAGFRGSGVEGLVYMNIIELAKQTGNLKEAEEWYKKLKNSQIRHSELYVKQLNSTGIVF